MERLDGSVKQKMDIDLGLTAAGRLLANLEITLQKPLRQAYGIFFNRQPEVGGP